MNSVRPSGSALRFMLRVTHIALWFTIPTTFWLWLAHAPPAQPRSCEPYCGWYQGNVLDISEDSFLLLLFGLFLLGFLVYACWTAGYCFDILKGALAGNRTLPPPRRSHLGQGWKLLWYSLAFWAPFFFAFVCVSLVFDAMRTEFTLRATGYVLALTIAIMPLLLLGNLVGIARYAASGGHSLLYRRRENIRLAMTNLVGGAVITFSAFVAAFLAGGALAAVAGLLDVIEVSDLIAEAAIASFAFHFILIVYCVLCANIVAGYAKRVAAHDNFKHSALGS